jgi:hypothetical protein
MYIKQPMQCPINALPPLFYDAVVEVCQQTEAPPEIVVADTFAFASTILQRLFKVMGPSGLLMPVSLNTLSAAPTAIGKGESFRRFSQWSSPAASLGQAKIAIDDLFLQDESFSDLMTQLAGENRSASIQLEDAYSFLDGPLMQRAVISKLPQVWSGPLSMKLGRHSGLKVAIEPCLAIGLRIQPLQMTEFLIRTKSFSRHLGFWTRFLTFCYDPDRFPVTSCFAQNAAPSMGNLPLMERLSLYLSSPEALSEPTKRKVLVLDAEANSYLRQIQYWIKTQMNGEFHDIQDAAGRAAENTLRLAGLFHVVSNGEVPITRDMVERAWQFVYWSLGQFRNVFVHAIQPPPKPLKLKLVKQPKLPSHQHRLNTDVQFLVQCIGARSGYFFDGKVPLVEAIVLSGFSKRRFMKALFWLITARWIETDGVGEHGTVRLLPVEQANFPLGYLNYGGHSSF